MTVAEYFLVFESIFFGLIIAQVLMGWNNMIANSEHFEFDWLHFLCTLAIFLAAIQNYYIGQVNLSAPKTILEFMFRNIFAPAALYIAAFQLFPQNINGEKLSSFILHKNWRFLIPTAVYYLCTILNSWYEYDDLNWFQWIPHITGAGLTIWAMFSRRKTILAIAIIYTLTMVVAFVALRSIN